MDFPPKIIENLASEDKTLVEVADLAGEEAVRIPTWWKDVLALPEHERIARAITEWNRALPGRFPKFFDHLLRTGTGIYLVRDRHGELHLLYVARDVDNQRPACWAGAMPLPTDDPAVRRGLPADLIGFHTTIHDGFRQVTGWYNGWLPMRNMFALSDNFDVNDADIEFYGTPPDFNRENLDLDQVIGVFAGSSYGYGVDIANRDNSAAGWYWFESTLEPTANFWEDIDKDLLVATR